MSDKLSPRAFAGGLAQASPHAFVPCFLPLSFAGGLKPSQSCYIFCFQHLRPAFQALLSRASKSLSLPSTTGIRVVKSRSTALRSPQLQATDTPAAFLQRLSTPFVAFRRLSPNSIFAKTPNPPLIFSPSSTLSPSFRLLLFS
jgi:hypothetical protein